MNIQHLRYFVHAARKGSVKAAARDLGFAPQTLSSSIKNLEECLGMPLFTRTSTGIALTHFGAEFLKEVEPLLAEFTRLESLPSRYSEGGGEPLQIKVGMSINAFHRVFSCGAFAHAAPNGAQTVFFTPVVCAPGDGLLALDEGLIDALIFETFDERRHLKRFDDFAIHKVASIPCLVALSKKSRLAQKDIISLNELSAYCFVSLSNNGLFKLGTVDKCARYGFSFNYLNDLSQSELNAWELVEADQAAMFVQTRCYWELDHPGCVYLPLCPENDISLDVFLVWREDRDCVGMGGLESLVAQLLSD